MTAPGRPGRENQASLTAMAASGLGWDAINSAREDSGNGGDFGDPAYHTIANWVRSGAAEEKTVRSDRSYSHEVRVCEVHESQWFVKAEQHDTRLHSVTQGSWFLARLL
ncbi:hypothetical protein BDZ85DRAFT_66368 [Elsinoe ampelina]|uniref:Uncharacterized protein n=1 Tax=Elsinoe ampelina TaxID=302913 RepID=A0A6A6GIY7_9PEZI|nr:hypothetical protein BDZ85DRAFT_66368 [Elsinoe ampelina]